MLLLRELLIGIKRKPSEAEINEAEELIKELAPECLEGMSVATQRSSRRRRPMWRRLWSSTSCPTSSSATTPTPPNTSSSRPTCSPIPTPSTSGSRRSPSPTTYPSPHADHHPGPTPSHRPTPQPPPPLPTYFLIRLLHSKTTYLYAICYFPLSLLPSKAHSHG
jgi:hypothetical protein